MRKRKPAPPSVTRYGDSCVGCCSIFSFASKGRLRLAGRLLRFYQRSGLQSFVRKTGLLPTSLQKLEAKAPRIEDKFSDEIIDEIEPARGERRYRVGLLTGCVQDLIYSSVNRDTLEVLRSNGCDVVTPRAQACCGSLHAHNGEYELAKDFARRLLDCFEVEKLDAIITNAAGCGSHLKHFDRLLSDDPTYAPKARAWAAKVRDISEWLVEIGMRSPWAGGEQIVAYHDACHLCHGQKITVQPREMLQGIPGLKLAPLEESMWCCGSAGIYNLIQPEMAEKLLQRKIGHIVASGARILATGNPGCLLQIQNGIAARGLKIEVVHPVTLLARAYRLEP